MKNGNVEVYRNPQLCHFPRRTVGMEGAKSVDELEHYSLGIEYKMGGEDRSYALLIRYYWDGETRNHYYFGQYDLGTFTEIVSEDELQARYNAVEENEGEEKAGEWFSSPKAPREIRGIEKDIQAALIRRWEALCELVSPHVTF
jgi:hypothetical protein